MRMISFIFLLTVLFSVGLYSLSLEKIKLPPGFQIEVYAQNLPQVREMSFAEDGTLFAGSKEGNIYAITTDRKTKILISHLNMPVGVSYFEGNLFFSEIPRIWKFTSILKNLNKKNLRPVLVNDRFPKNEWHGWKFIRVGPDKKLYVPVGGPCNVCMSEDPRFATIQRMDLNGSNLEIFASGIRNTVGFDWDPKTKELWFTDNGRDWMGDLMPPDELNHAPVKGLHFGFPYLHGTTNQDLMFWDQRPTNITFILPELNLPAHVAALGMRFYTGKEFPEYYRGGIFIAEHGSWNRTHKIGYRVIFIKLINNKPVGEEVFAEGWIENEIAWGRPADVESGKDGSLYVADDLAGCIYRIWYSGNKQP